MSAPAAVERPAAGDETGLPEPVPAGGEGRPQPGRPGGGRAPAPDAAPWLVLGTVLTILGALLLGFVVDLVLLGGLRHARDQRVAYAHLRFALKEPSAPVGQTGPDGHLLTLGTPVAWLEIPQLGVHEVVFEGTTAGVLRSGPGHRRDTPLPGQAGTSVIFGRRAAFGGPFNDLDRMEPEMIFRVTTGQGVHQFRVLDLRRAGDPQPAPPATGAGRLTLVTATGRPFLPTGALRVDAELISPVQPAPPRPLSTGSLPAAEKVMAAEPAAWVAIVLWAEMLLLAALGVTWLRIRWGGWQAWTVAVPVLGTLGIVLSGEIARLLPNLL